MTVAIRPDARPVRPAMERVSIDRMRRRHLRSVLAIERMVYPRPWSSSLFASELAQGDTRRYFVALAAQRGGGLRSRRAVVGYAGMMLVVGEAHITTVAVHPHHHRRKIASRLLVALLRDARALGAEAATLEVRVANAGAQRLYSAFGFAPVGVRPGYYVETGEDAVIMWAHDLQSDAVAERISVQEARLDQPGGDSGAPDLPVPWVHERVGLHDEMED